METTATAISRSCVKALSRLCLPALLPFTVSICKAAIILNCVGDSITAGDGYPTKLQGLLGTNYLVQNYGLSGATLLKQGDKPYCSTSNYTLSHGQSSATAPDVVIIMLGSNDAKPWNWVYGTNYVSDYLDLIATYVTNQYRPNPRILICTPPPAWGDGFTIDPGILATNISPRIRQLGSEQSIQVIDMQRLLAGHNEWFSDGVHPNPQGTSVMAAIAYTALQADPTNDAAPALGIGLTSQKVVLKWPAAGAGWVLQFASVLGNPKAWRISLDAAVNDGTSVRVTNSVSAQKLVFRLWNPSVPIDD
jgi:lysophospholipase L1-like esterase